MPYKALESFIRPFRARWFDGNPWLVSRPDHRLVAQWAVAHARITGSTAHPWQLLLVGWKLMRRTL